MTGQDNDTFESQVIEGMFDVVLEAGRTSSNGDASIDLRRTLDALCTAIASFAATTIGRTEGPDAAAAELEREGERMADLLNFLAGKVRAGELALPSVKRPKPRLVD